MSQVNESSATAALEKTSNDMMTELKATMAEANKFQIQLQMLNIEHATKNAKHEMVQSLANRIAQSGS